MKRNLPRTSNPYGLAIAALAGIALVGGYGLAIAARADSQQEVNIRFRAAVGDRPFNCQERYDLGTPARQVAPLDLRFYVSELALVDASGNLVPVQLEQDGKWQYQNVALLDFEDKTGSCANGTSETRSRVVGSVPAGDYRGLRFTLGVPFALNHDDATLAPSPLNLTSLWWNWNLGYKFARIDFALAGSMGAMKGEGEGGHHHHHSDAQGFVFHLGSTGCRGSSGAPKPDLCAAPNRAEMSFDRFDPEQNIVVLDLEPLLAATNLAANQPETPMGCMSSPDDGDCAAIMEHLGLPFGDRPSWPQTAFRVE